MTEQPKIENAEKIRHFYPKESVDAYKIDDEFKAGKKIYIIVSKTKKGLKLKFIRKEEKNQWQKE